MRTEVVVFDDGSTDKTVTLAQKAGAKVVSLHKNTGVGFTLRRGFEYGINQQADILVQIDADGQFDPQNIPALIKPIIKDQVQFVTCSRFMPESVRPPMPLINLVGNIILARFVSLVTNHQVADVSCGFRAYSREALLRLSLFGNTDCNQEVFISLARHHIYAHELPLPVKATQRSTGESRVLKNKLIYSMKLGVILVRSLRDASPLLFFAIPATILVIAGISFYLLYWINQWVDPGVYWLSYKLGTVGWSLTLVGGILYLFALLGDMIDRLRRQNEEIIYALKTNQPDS